MIFDIHLIYKQIEMPKVQCFEAEKLLLFGVAAMTESFAHVKSSRCLKAVEIQLGRMCLPQKQKLCQNANDL